MLVPRRGIEYFGNLAFVGGGGGGDGGAKGKAAIGVKSKTGNAGEYTYIEYFTTPKYDTLSELNVSESKFVAASDGYYKIHMVVLLLSTEPAVVSFDFEILKNDTDVIAEKTVTKVSDLLFIYQVDCSVTAELVENDFIVSRLYYNGATTFSILESETLSYLEFFKL